MESNALTGESVGQVGQYLTTKEAGKRLGYTARWIRHMCESGQLIAIKFGGRWLIDEQLIGTLPQSAVHDTS